MSDLLRPELFDEPLSRTDEEIEGAYGKDWLKALSDKIAARKAGKPSKSGEDKGEQIELEDKFLPRRK